MRSRHLTEFTRPGIRHSPRCRFRSLPSPSLGGAGWQRDGSTGPYAAAGQHDAARYLAIGRTGGADPAGATAAATAPGEVRAGRRPRRLWCTDGFLAVFVGAVTARQCRKKALVGTPSASAPTTPPISAVPYGSATEDLGPVRHLRPGYARAPSLAPSCPDSLPRTRGAGSERERRYGRADP